MYRGFRALRDFIGMDMCRKFLEMGFTRARRYANHKNGKKYKDGKYYRKKMIGQRMKKRKQRQSLKSLEIKVTKDPKYQSMRADWRELENVSN